jgi:hypothetical protein
MNKRLALILETVENIMEAEGEGVVVIDPKTGDRTLVSGRAAHLAIARGRQQKRGGNFTPRTTDNPRDVRRVHSELENIPGLQTHNTVTRDPETGRLKGRLSGMTDKQRKEKIGQAAHPRTRTGRIADLRGRAAKPEEITSEQQYEGDSDIGLGASGALDVGRIPDGGKPKPKLSKKARRKRRVRAAKRTQEQERAAEIRAAQAAQKEEKG